MVCWQTHLGAIPMATLVLAMGTGLVTTMLIWFMCGHNGLNSCITSKFIYPNFQLGGMVLGGVVVGT